MPDRSVIDCFKKLGELYKVTSLNVRALGFSQIGNIDMTSESNEEFQAIIKHDSMLIDSCTLNISGLRVSYHRGGQYQPDQKSPIYDEILLIWDQKGKLNNIDKLKIVTLINTELKAFEPGRFIDSGLSQEQNQLLSIHEGTLERLERLNEDLIRQSSEFRENIEKRFEEKTLELEKEKKAKQDKLEDVFAKKTEALESKEKDLKEKLKTIDDRDNTHVRREIRDRMLDDVKNRISNFGVSESTEKKRTPVFIGIIALMFTLIVLMVFTGYEISVAEKRHTVAFEAAYKNDVDTKAIKNVQSPPKAEFSYADKPKLYWLWIRFALFSFGLIGTVLYYIKWQNWWAEYHSSSEFQLQQFYIDVNRANWVIESCLEWRKETDSAIPTELLISITRNLFVSEQGELEKAKHPADELASALLGSASKLKLNLGGNELEFDKPGKITSKAKPITNKKST